MPPLEALSERERIARWREQQLLAAGYPSAEALELARRLDVDLHRAVKLRATAGDVAIRILR